MSYNPRDPAQNWLPVYVRTVADRMTLRDWELKISFDSPDNEDAEATMEPLPGRRFAILRLGVDFWKQPREWQRQTVVHELLHCHFSNAQEFARTELKPRTYRPWLLMHEGGIDSVADAVAPFMPLPPRPGKKSK